MNIYIKYRKVDLFNFVRSYTVKTAKQRLAIKRLSADKILQLYGN